MPNKSRLNENTQPLKKAKATSEFSGQLETQINNLMKNKQFDDVLIILNGFLASLPNAFNAKIKRSEVYCLMGQFDNALTDLSDALAQDPNNVFALARRGDVYRQKNQFDNALTDLNAALAQQPTHVFALARRGDIYRQKNQLDNALTDLSAALAQQPNHVFALARRGDVYRQKNQLNNALTDLSAALAQQPNIVFALARRGDVYRQKNEFDNALTDLNAALAQQPNHVFALARRGDVYRQKNEFDNALMDLNAALAQDPNYVFALVRRVEIYRQTNNFNNALTDLNALLAQRPNDVFALAIRGEIYRQMNQFDNALRDLNAALALQPNDVFALAIRGEVYRRKNEFDNALMDLNAALAQDPNYVFALARRGEVYRQKNEFDNALMDLNAALAQDPNDVFALAIRGEVYRQMNQFDNALTDLNALLALQPNHVFALARRGEVYRQTSQLDNALTDLNAALALQPNDVFALARRGEVYRQTNPFDALTDFNAALALQPNDVFALARRGEVYRQSNQFDNALMDLSAALALQPNDVFALVRRGEVYRQTNHFNKALMDLNAALALQPNDVFALAIRGEVYRQMNQFDNALMDFNAALAQQPNNVFALARRGEVYRQKNQFNNALTDLNAALAQQPNYLFALARRGEVYRQKNDFNNALTDLNAALALQPNDVFALARRGAVYRQMGDLDNALVDLNKAFDNSSQDGFILHQRSLVYWQQNKNDAALNDLDAWESQSEEHVAEFVQVAEIAEEETSSEPTPKESLVSKDFSSNPIRIEASDEQVLPETSGLSLTPTPMETDNLAFGSINTEEQAGSSTGSQNSGEETSRTTKEFKKPWQKNALFSAKYSAKYERLPPAPIRLFHTHRNNYSQVFDFKTLESCELSENTMGARRLISLSIGQSTFRLSTMKREHPASDETVTFIFAGRKENARLPNPAALGDKQRLLLVVSAGEYKSFSNLNYTDAVEFLIIDSLESSTHGSYQIEDIQARRLAAFILSFHWQLKHCVYLDDNLELIQSTPNYPALSTWAEITDVLKADRDKEQAVLCGMQTFSYKPHYYVEPDYCYKLFNLDFQQLTQLLHLETADDVFILGYPAKYSGYCMQDFYFQMIIDFALYAANSKQETGHLMKKLVYLPPMESISLKRMKQNQNAAKAYTRGLIEDILTITTDEFVPQGIREEYVQLMKESLMHLHNEIKRSFNLMSKKRRELVTRDFRSIVQANNQIAPSESFNNLEPELLEKNAKKPKKSAKPIPINDNFLRTNWVGCQISALAPAEVVDTYLQEKPVSDSLYPHQLAAIKMISRCNQSHGVLKMATGSGKTRVQIVFANFLIKRNPNAVIHIVVPTVQLVNQFYQEFVQTLDTLEESGAIKKENIVPVHSKENGVAAGLITLNTIFRSEASVYIFCEASYSKMLATAEKNLANHRAPLLIMLDEFHLYKHKARILMDSGVSTLGFSATPGPDIVPLYEFNRADSRAALRTAPLIIDRLSYSLNLEKNEKKHHKIATLIRHHRHPMGKPLASYKGIIYTSSIEEANDLTSAINREAGEQLAQAIHSQVKDYKKWVELFRKKSLETPAILVVVDMLGTGYDDKDVVWGLFAKNNGVGVENHSQMAGRGLRLNSDYPEKIAYMLTDDDLLFDIQEIYKDEDALIMAHPDYYTYNREVIYLELLNAVEKQRPFKHYSAMFRHNKLNYSLSKHLILLMKALDSNEQEWVQGLLSENKVLKENWKGQRGKVFNLIGTFLNEVIGLQEGHQDPLKARLFTVDAFQNVLNAVHSHSSALLKQLLTDASVQRTLTEQFKKVSGEYFTIFQQYRSLVNGPNALPNRYGFLQRLDRPRGSNFYLQEPMVSNTYSSQSSL